MAESSSGSPVRSFFLGNVDEICFYPFPALSAEEQETVDLILDSVRRFLTDRSPHFREYDVKNGFPKDFIDELKALGLFGILIPPEMNGAGLSAQSYARIVQELAYFDASTALTIGAHTSIGMRGLLLFGTDEQKQRYLPRLATGEMIAAFCLTEPQSGSDAASIRTKAVRQEDGSYLLSGEKIWITNGGIADFFTVFARTGEDSLTAFIVERQWSGVSIGTKEDKMGIRASSTTPVIFQDVRVPAENVLGKAGEGFRVAMTILNNGRTGLGGGCVGSMRRCLALATEYAATRKQFGRPIGDFGLIQEKIAEMAALCFASETVVALVSDYIDSKRVEFSVEAAISKVFATESLWTVSNHALQIAGGNGFMREYPYEQIVRDSRINMIFEGSNEILRLYIALTGLKDAGTYLTEISESLSGIFNDPIESLGLLSGYVARKFSTLTTVGLPALEFPHPALRAEARVFEIYVHRLSQAAEAVLRAYGKKVVERQPELKRLADVAIDLFVGLGVLGRVSTLLHAGKAQPDGDEVRMALLFTRQAKRRMNQTLRRLAKNEDVEVAKLSKSLVEGKGYRWDASFGK